MNEIESHYLFIMLIFGFMQWVVYYLPNHDSRTEPEKSWRTGNPPTTTRKNLQYEEEENIWNSL